MFRSVAIPYAAFGFVLAAAVSLSGGAAIAAAAAHAGPYRVTVVNPADGRAALGRTRLVLQVTDAATDRAATLRRLTIAPSMPQMPMALSARNAKALGGGRYAVPLVLSMAGAYHLSLSAVGAAGRGHTTLALTVPGPIVPATDVAYVAAAAVAALILVLGVWRLRQPAPAPTPTSR